MSDTELSGGRRGLSVEQEIASEQLDALRNNPGRCAWLSVHAGRHPWVRWSEARGAYECVERSQIGNLEVNECSEDDLLNLFAENPVDIKPLSTTDVWEKVDDGHESVIYADGRPA